MEEPQRILFPETEFKGSSDFKKILYPQPVVFSVSKHGSTVYAEAKTFDEPRELFSNGH